jgi:hypothetical protein
VSASDLASTDVLILLNEHSSTQIDPTEDGFTLTKVLTQRVKTPPSWRTQWPNGRTELRELRNFADSDNSHLTAQQPGKTTGERLLARHVLWNLPVDEMLTSTAHDGAHRLSDVPAVLEYAKWCDEYDRANDAMNLRISAVERDTAAVPPMTASKLLETLMNIGRR